MKIVRKSVEKVPVALQTDTNNSTLHEDQYTFMIISLSALLKLRNVPEKMFENQSIYEIMWKNIVDPGRPQMTVQRMRIACWIAKVRDTHSEYEYLPLSTTKMFK